MFKWLVSRRANYVIALLNIIGGLFMVIFESAKYWIVVGAVLTLVGAAILVKQISHDLTHGDGQGYE